MPQSPKTHPISAILFLLLTLALTTTACRTTQPAETPNSTQENSQSLPEQQPPPTPQTQEPQQEPQDCRQTGCDNTAQCLPRDQLDCSSYEYCKKSGACSLIPQTETPEFGEYLCTNWLDAVCGARSDDDCLQSTGCKKDGACEHGSFRAEIRQCYNPIDEDDDYDYETHCTMLYSNICLPSESGCQKSLGCTESGNCGVQTMYWGKTCRPMKAQHCAQSDICKSEGRCGMISESGNECTPTQDSHCRQSEVCIEQGRCYMHGTDIYCLAKQEFDCQKSKACKSDGKCFLSQNRCVIQNDVRPQ